MFPQRNSQRVSLSQICPTRNSTITLMRTLRPFRTRTTIRPMRPVIIQGSALVAPVPITGLASGVNPEAGLKPGASCTGATKRVWFVKILGMLHLYYNSVTDLGKFPKPGFCPCGGEFYHTYLPLVKTFFQKKLHKFDTPKTPFLCANVNQIVIYFFQFFLYNKGTLKEGR